MRTKPISEKNIAPTIICTAPWRLTRVKPLVNYQLEVEFIDGTCGIVDLAKRVMSDKGGVFIKLRDIRIFNQVTLEHGVVTWPGEIDLAPDAMHDEIKHNGKWILV